MEHIIHSFAQTIYQLTRSYRILLWFLTIGILVGIIWQPYILPNIVKLTTSHIILLRDYQINNLVLKVNELLNQAILNREEGILKDALDEPIGEKNSIGEYVISTGDTLSDILTQYGVNAYDIIMIVQQNPVLRNLKKGQSISWKLTIDSSLQQLTWEVSQCETRIYDRINNIFKESIINLAGEWRNIIFTGRLNGSFVTSARVAGLTNREIYTVIQALQWQLDFRKLHKGDQFLVLILRKILDEKNIQSQLVGVHLRNISKDYYAFRADNGKFYDCNAVGLTNNFMRFPIIKQFRISSNFNPHRRNPVTNRIVPHRGVDFAVPIGTAVLAIGDGEVIISKRDEAAGNYVAIRHNYQYMTRYMHLKKILVKLGKKVKRGDLIALSGNTGISTGPHLHYEMWINEQAVNPLTAKLPYTDHLRGDHRADYLAYIKKILPKLQLK